MKAESIKSTKITLNKEELAACVELATIMCNVNAYVSSAYGPKYDKLREKLIDNGFGIDLSNCTNIEVELQDK